MKKCILVLAAISLMSLTYGQNDENLFDGVTETVGTYLVHKYSTMDYQPALIVNKDSVKIIDINFGVDTFKNTEFVVYSNQKGGKNEYIINMADKDDNIYDMRIRKGKKDGVTVYFVSLQNFGEKKTYEVGYIFLKSVRMAYSQSLTNWFNNYYTTN
jgi:hypothetical protein